MRGPGSTSWRCPANARARRATDDGRRRRHSGHRNDVSHGLRRHEGWAVYPHERAGNARQCDRPWGNARFFGCIVGRFANHIHGGLRGFDKAVWAEKLWRKRDAAGIRWTYTSRDGEEGYPGTLKVTADYTLTEDNTLTLEYWAVTDAPTPVNITNHSYWNLAGAGTGTILAQEISFNCPFYLPVDAGLLPTGEVLKTKGTAFDFETPKSVGRDIGEVPGGYDHCLVIGKPAGELGLACTARDPGTGRTMQVWMTKPGLQFYTANFLDGKPFPKHAAFCLETQFFPDSVNQGHFPSCILRPGQTYRHLTVHKFSA